MIKSKSMSVLTPYGVKNMVAADSTIKINKLKINNNHRVFVKTKPEKTGVSEKRQESARTRFCAQFYPPRNIGSASALTERRNTEEEVCQWISRTDFLNKDFKHVFYQPT